MGTSLGFEHDFLGHSFSLPVTAHDVCFKRQDASNEVKSTYFLVQPISVALIITNPSGRSNLPLTPVIEAINRLDFVESGMAVDFHGPCKTSDITNTTTKTEVIMRDFAIEQLEFLDENDFDTSRLD